VVRPAATGQKARETRGAREGQRSEAERYGKGPRRRRQPTPPREGPARTRAGRQKPPREEAEQSEAEPAADGEGTPEPPQGGGGPEPKGRTEGPTRQEAGRRERPKAEQARRPADKSPDRVGRAGRTEAGPWPAEPRSSSPLRAQRTRNCTCKKEKPLRTNGGPDWSLTLAGLFLIVLL